MGKEVDGEIKYIPLLKSSYVFNRAQLQNWEYKPFTIEPFECNIEKVDRFVQNTQAIIEHDNGRACYMHSPDKILIPYSYSFTDTPTRTVRKLTTVHLAMNWFTGWGIPGVLTVPKAGNSVIRLTPAKN